MTKVTSDVTGDIGDIATVVGAIPYLASLSVRERADLAARCRVRAFGKGAVVFTEGEAATGLWVMLAGRVRLVHDAARARAGAPH